MIWGAISMEARTDLVFIRRGNCLPKRGGLIGIRYIEEILAMNVIPYVDYILDEFIFFCRKMQGRIPQESCKITLPKPVFRSWNGQRAVKISIQHNVYEMS